MLCINDNDDGMFIECAKMCDFFSMVKTILNTTLNIDNGTKLEMKRKKIICFAYLMFYVFFIKYTKWENKNRLFDANGFDKIEIMLIGRRKCSFYIHFFVVLIESNLYFFPLYQKKIKLKTKQ